MLITSKEIIISLQIYLVLHLILYLVKVGGVLLYKHFVTTDHLKAIFNHKYQEHAADNVAACFLGDCGEIKQ